MPGVVVLYTRYASMKTTIIKKASSDSALWTEAEVSCPDCTIASVSETK